MPPGTFQRSGVLYYGAPGQETAVYYTTVHYRTGSTTRTDVIHDVYSKVSSSRTCSPGMIHYT